MTGGITGDVTGDVTGGVNGGRIGRMRWQTHGNDWPNRDASRFARASGLGWHVQEAGAPGAPKLLLLHGTGAATHSWGGLLPLLAKSFHVLAPDLPGHGFTEMPLAERMSLPGMSGLIDGLLRTLGFAPDLVAGHSAGAAVAARLILDGRIHPAGLVSLNGALLPLPGPSAQFSKAAARVLARTRVVPWIFSLQAARRDLVTRLLGNTGSTLAEADLRFYRRLLLDPHHVAAALQMMANWDLPLLQPELSRLRLPVLLLAGSRDRMIPPGDAVRLAELLPDARLATLEGLGHLAHEEQPAQVAAWIAEFASGLTPPGGGRVDLRGGGNLPLDAEPLPAAS